MVDRDILNFDYWTNLLGEYNDNLEGEILLFNISNQNLLKANEDVHCPDDYLEEICRIDSNDWDTLEKFISKEEVKIEKKDALNYLKSFKEECEDCKEECECEFKYCLTLLFSEKQYIHSCVGYSL